MDRSIAEQLLRMFTAKSPRDVAEMCLDFVLGASHASVGAVFRLDGGRPVLYASRGITQRGLDWMGAHWDRVSGALVKQQAAIVYREHSVAPIIGAGELRGVVYCEGTTVCEEAALEVSEMLLDAICADDGPGLAPTSIDQYLTRIPPAELARRKLLLALGQHEWNIARVAREYGVTRTTIYRRLEELGLDRDEIRGMRLNAKVRLRGVQ